MEYYLVYMTGLAGKGGGSRNAENSARLFNQLNPYFISVDSLTLFPDTELYRMAQQGLFVPAGEKERIRELQMLIKNLKSLGQVSRQERKRPRQMSSGGWYGNCIFDRRKV